jgi:hypothetical protein
MPNLSWWEWLAAGALAFAGLCLLSLGYLAWAFKRAPMDTDLWEGGDPNTRWLTSDERTDGSCNRRAS